MKIIDLLNKIANEELKKKPNLDNIPYKIKYDDIEYSLLYELGKDGKNYITYSEDNLSEDVYGELEISLFGLNDEVEIIDYLEEIK